MKALRQRITIARRGIRQAGELLAGLQQPFPPGWADLVVEMAELVKAARAIDSSAELSSMAQVIEGQRVQVEQWVKAVAKPVETTPVGLGNEPHNTNTNLNSEPSDTVIAFERSSGFAGISSLVPKPQVSTGRQGISGVRTSEQVLELFPRLEQYVTARESSWPDIVDAAGGALRHELGVSTTLWGEACRVMGREGAALALAIVSTKPAAHFTRGPGGYFGGMLRRAEKGELYLDKTLWALRGEKMGRPPSRAMKRCRPRSNPTCIGMTPSVSSSRARTECRRSCYCRAGAVSN